MSWKAVWFAGWLINVNVENLLNMNNSDADLAKNGTPDPKNTFLCQNSQVGRFSAKVRHLMARVAYLQASLAYIRMKKASAVSRLKQHAAVYQSQTPTGGWG